MSTHESKTDLILAVMLVLISVITFNYNLRGVVVVVNPELPIATTAIRPARLIIPKISVNANIEYVGTTTSGNMAVASNYTDVAWYKEGSAPGAPGNAVLAGHVNTSLGLHGVFHDLPKLSPGDKVIVVGRDNKQLDFTVTSVQSYSARGAPVSDIFRQDGAPGLALITCNGSWLRETRTYTERLVVYASLN